MDVKRAAVYARYSSEEQTGGESIEYQLERCREYIAKQRWSVAEINVFVDRAKSGTSTYPRWARRPSHRRGISVSARLPCGCSVAVLILVAMRTILTILRLLSNRILTLDVDT